MPNHVTNRICATGCDLSPFIASLGGDRNHFDFDLIVPRPSIIAAMGDVDSRVSGWAEISLGLMNLEPPGILERFEAAGHLRQLKEEKGVSDFSDDDFELFVSYLRSYRATGAVTNLDWSRKYWGTKWNSYELNAVSLNEVFFKTAWTAPHPVIERLAETLRSNIVHEWADENTGCNVGRRAYSWDPSSGMSFSEELLEGEKEGWDLAFALMPYQAKDYQWDGTNYVYREDQDA